MFPIQVLSFSRFLFHAFYNGEGIFFLVLGTLIIILMVIVIISVLVSISVAHLAHLGKGKVKV